MRVLILSAILALVTAAPSGELKDAAPLAVLPVVSPTIDPGDIQAAAINAQVAVEDQARAVADKIVEESNEKVVVSDSLVKEKTEETFWAGEEKKWQALDAVNTAAAKIDGAVASNADAIARSAIGGLVVPTYVAPSLLPAPLVRTPIIPGTINTGLPVYGAPVISPLSPLVYTPNLIAKNEENKNKLVKTAELEKDKQVLQTLYPGQIVSAPVLSPLDFIPGYQKEDEKEKPVVKIAEFNKDKPQVLQTVYQEPVISPTPLVYYNTNVFFNGQDSSKEKGKEIVNTDVSDKDQAQVYLYATRIITPVFSPYYPIVYTTKVVDKTEEILKNGDIENNAELKKEESKLDEKKDEKLLDKAEKDKLEKQVVAGILPLVAPQWPLSPAAPVYIPQQVLTPVINTQW